MSEPVVRINLWSGPRNISTAMMRAFENRPDCAVIDEPFYGVYLAATGLDHPLRDQVLAASPTDWRRVREGLLGPVPGGEAILYAKQMTHHMIPAIDTDWMREFRNAFLIRPPEEVVASYAARRAEVSLEDLGFVRQAELFEREAERLGRAPPVIDARDVLEDPRGTLTALCAALDISFDPAMLAWPAGPRATDGPWAPAWYAAVEASTGFGPPPPPVRIADLDPHLRPIAQAARPYYERLAAHRLRRPSPLAGEGVGEADG
jgi:hypothetical protein